MQVNSKKINGVYQLILAAAWFTLLHRLDLPLSNGARMQTIAIDYSSDSERIMIEQAVAYAKHLNQLAHSAPVGTVLNVCERAALDEGKKFLRSTLEAAVQSRIDQTEKKGAKPGLVRDVPSPSGIRVGNQEMC